MKMAIGIDVHKETSTAYAVYAGDSEEKGKQKEYLESFNKEFGRFPSTPEEYKRLMVVRGHECHILLENSTKTHEVYWILKNGGLSVTVAHSTDLVLITKSIKKTDHHDSVELAGYMRRRLRGEDREFAVSFIPSPEWMLKREMCRGVLAEKEYLANTKRRMRAHLLLHGISLSREYDNIAANTALIEMSIINDPYLRMLIRFADDAKKRVSMGENTIKRMFNGDKTCELIDSVTGFGHTSAAYMSALIVDVSRFRSRSEFTASFGVVPKMRSSGESNPRCATTHRGDDLMRKRLMDCTRAHIRFEPDSVVTVMYNRLVNNGKSKKEAQVAASRKLLTVVWSVLKSGKPYSSDSKVLKPDFDMKGNGM
jgi:transposase